MLHVQIHTLFTMVHPADPTLLDFKIAVATNIIGPYTSGKRAAPESNIGSIRAYRYKHEPTEVSDHLSDYQQNAHGCD